MLVFVGWWFVSHFFPVPVTLDAANIPPITVDAVNARFPDVQHHVVGGFIFLRFICPALLSPTRWNFTAEVTSKAQRAIILISKTLQNLANGVKFSAAKPEMMEMNRSVCRARARGREG